MDTRDTKQRNYSGQYLQVKYIIPIFFRLIDGVVRIERILHGSRNLPVVLLSGSENADSK